MPLPFDNDGAAIGEVEPGLQLQDVFGRRVRSGEVVEEETGLEEHVLEDFGGGVDGCELGLDGGFSVGEGGGNLSADEIVSGGLDNKLARRAAGDCDFHHFADVGCVPLRAQRTLKREFVTECWNQSDSD